MAKELQKCQKQLPFQETSHKSTPVNPNHFSAVVTWMLFCTDTRCSAGVLATPWIYAPCKNQHGVVVDLWDNAYLLSIALPTTLTHKNRPVHPSKTSSAIGPMVFFPSCRRTSVYLGRHSMQDMHHCEVHDLCQGKMPSHYKEPL